jgi:hypothetical protein
MWKQVTSSINRLLSKSTKKTKKTKTTKKQLMKIAKEHDKGETKKKKKKKKKKKEQERKHTNEQKKKKKKKSRTYMKRSVSNKGIEGKEGIDFKTFYIDPTKPSSCMTKRKCKSHRMNIPKRRNRCKSNKGKNMMNHMKTPTKKCNESFVHFLHL